MPLNNNFYGIYKVMWVNTGVNGFYNSNTGIAPYIISSLKDRTTMQADTKFFMQGDPRSRIYDIGNIDQTFEVSAPVLVNTSGPSASGASIRDGWLLLKDFLNKVYPNGINTTISALPILSKATLNVTSNESSISFTITSDGDPGNTPNVYQINSYQTSNYSGQSTAQQLGISSGARVARNYDFVATFGTIHTYIIDMNVNFDIETKKNYFIGDGTSTSVVPPADVSNGGVFPDGSKTYSGWQFPFISVGGIKASATGKAAVSIGSTNSNNVNYNQQNVNLYGQTSSSSFPTAASIQAASNVGLQTSGQLTVGANTFILGIFNGFGATSNFMPSQLVFNSAIVDSSNYQFTGDGVMTFDFSVKAVYTGS
jgi:hypothetical protein